MSAHDSGGGMPAIPGLTGLEPVASGGTSDVYSGRAADGARVAVKVLRAGAGDALLRNEFRVLRGLAHPNVAPVYDYGRLGDGRAYVTAVWVAGEPLRRELFVRDGRIDSRLFADAVRQIASALAHVHARRLVHGDLKPANVLVETSGDAVHVTVVDFGLSRARGTGIDGLSGTFEYLAPELVRGEACSPAGDMYALGCVLYEAAVGAPPFVRDTPVEVLKAQLAETPPPVPPSAGLDDEIADWIRLLMEKEPQRRLRDASALERLASGKTGAAVAPERAEPAAAFILPDTPLASETAKALELFEQSRVEPRALRVAGPRGIGKTRFLSQLRMELQFRGARTLSTDGRTPQPFSAVARLLRAADPATVASAAPEHAAIVESAFPGTFPGLGTHSVPALDAAGEKLRLFHATAEILETALEFDAVFFDDFDDADLLSRECFRHYAGYLDANERGRRLLVTAVRDAGAGEAAELPRSTTIPLPTLPSAAVGEAVRAMLGTRVSGSFADVVHARSGGVPGRIPELLSFAHEAGILERTAHGWVVHERDNLGALFPATPSDALLGRIPPAGSDARAVLEAAALSPAAVDPALLADVTGLALDACFAACVELADRGFLRSVDGGFLPADEAPLDAVAPAGERRTALHDRFVAAYGRGQKTDDETLAHHLLGGGTPAQAVEPLRAAAERRLRAFDAPAAERLFAAALPFTTEAGTEETRFEILRRLCEVCHVRGERDAEQEYIQELFFAAGRLGRPAAEAEAFRRRTELSLATGDFPRAQESARRAMNRYREAADDLGVAWCHQQIGYAAYRTRPDERVRDAYERAREIFASRGAAREEGDVEIDIGVLYTSVLDDPERALEHFARALDIFVRIGDGRGEARAVGNMGFQYYYRGEYDRALEHHARANALFRRIGDRRRVGVSLNGMAQCELAAQRFADAAVHLHEAARISREVRDDVNLEAVEENLGELYFTLGMYDVAEAHYTRARDLADRLGKRAGVAANDVDLAGAAIEKRDLDAAARLLRKAGATLESVDDMNLEAMYLYRLGIFHLTKGPFRDDERALAQFRALGDLADRHGLDAQRVLASSYAAVAHLRLGRPKEALELSNRAMDLLARTGHLVGGTHDIVYNHALVLRGNRRLPEAAAAIDRAHEALLRAAESIADARMSRSFLENVAVNADIVREHALLHRGASKDALAAVREQNLRTLYGVSAKITSTLDLPVLLDAIMDSALEAMNGERGLIFLLENGQLVLKVSRNVERETIRDATEISLSILHDVVTGGRPIIVSDTAKDEAFRSRESVVNYHIHSLLCVPMKSKDAVIGTVYVDTRGDAVTSMRFSEIDAEFLEAFANLASVAIENARLVARVREENVYLRTQVERKFGFENIVGESAAMRRLFAEIQAAVGSEAAVLVSGESGTGKELVARAIHFNGERAEARFVALDCGALPDTLLESELFGYKRGAFTGAYADKPGLFEEAHRGTLFLDEIANTSLAFQARLLRVLQEGEYRRVGDTVERNTDVRIICATNRVLTEEIAAQRFRQDLFFRLNVIPIHIPPLRERTADIPLLVEHFVVRFNERNRTAFRGASPELLEHLKTLPWPGNVRELENLLERMMSVGTDPVLALRHLPDEYSAASTAIVGASALGLAVSLRPPQRLLPLRDVEREHIAYVLQNTGGNKSEAAKILGLKRTTLVEKMKKLGMM